MRILQKVTAKEKTPAYLVGRVAIIGRYHESEFQKTRQAAKAFSELGIDTYPSAHPRSCQLRSGSGEIFNFFGGDTLVDPPYLTQLGFFRLLREEIKNVRKTFCYVAIQDGYLGRTASIETGYVMALRKYLLFSELPTTFSSEVPSIVVSVIKENCMKYPVLPVEKISAMLPRVLEQTVEFPEVTKIRQRGIYFGIVALLRDLRKEFGFEIVPQGVD